MTYGGYADRHWEGYGPHWQYGGDPTGVYTNLPGGVYAADTPGQNPAAVQDAIYIVPDSGPNAPEAYIPDNTVPPADAFASKFDEAPDIDNKTIGSADFGAIGGPRAIAGADSMTSDGAITTFDGNKMVVWSPTNELSSITVTLDKSTNTISVIQNPHIRI